jgi:hypothetical protein
LINQRPVLRVERVASLFQFLAAAQELWALDEARLVEIGQPAALSCDGVDFPVEASKLGGEQLVASCLPPR